MLMLQRNQAWRGLQTGGVWKWKVDILYKQHQLSPINMQQLKHIIFQNLLNDLVLQTAYILRTEWVIT